ncbi:putative protein N(5)-glutamine methyltransferase [Cellulomonas sp. JZ18]|uniref:putative protein N(5)-glutamine methyltransferase n=1 Tax=Cellulomonas sp. JZ18 TaxID=2654191 RepID=UPI0012D4A29B|nr:putative protein N(5)-glutamine methyltransferase [Cellulomonas sp. JZ18]QGQ20140.1 putative protein N(5)-glutamine methyltransferase [Cellulomonas sp. JZ18]
MTSSAGRGTAPGPDPLVARLRAAGCVFAEEEADLLRAAAGEGGDLDALTDRRVAGEPLETVLGWVAFAGRRVAVGPGVFVPRRRTELLARTAVRLARDSGPAPVVVELCCGVAAVATVVAQDVPGARVHAADVDPAAVRWAAVNLAGRGTVTAGDLFDALPPDLRGGVDVLVANAPYVPSDAVATMPVESRAYEPRVAVDGGADGVDVQRRLLAGAEAWVRPGGHAAVETGEQQAPVTAAAFPPGWDVRVLRDEDVDATVVVGRRPG